MADLTEQEITAGIAAAHAAIKETVPGWEQSMIPDEAISGLVARVVAAVDDVRAVAAANSLANTPHVAQAAWVPPQGEEDAKT